MTWLLGKVIGNPLLIVWIAIGAFVAGGVGAWKVQGWRLDAVKAEYQSFVAQTKTLGEAAQKAADVTKAADKSRKEQADVENKRTLDSLRADVKRLRLARAGSHFLPAAAPDARSPQTACFARGELESALQRFDTGASEIVGVGDEARVNLDTAKVWAAHP